MGSVIVPEAEGFLGAVKGGGAGEICADPVPVLVLGQHFLHRNGDKLSVSVPEAARKFVRL